MIRPLILLVLLTVACAKRGPADPDESLPDLVQPVTALEPMGVLEEGANDEDPTPRARSLELLIRVSPQAAGGGWGPRALWDPDAWVQRKGVEALVSRIDEPATVALLEKYVARGGELVDPYVRGMAAMRLAEAGHPAIHQIVADAWRKERAPWLAAPLQLAAAYMGDDEAMAPLSKAVSRGDLALEVAFVRDLGASKLVGLLPALREGGDWVEEELALPYAVARLALGDADAEAILRKALSNDDEETQLEALDYLSVLDSPLATELLRKVRGGSGGLTQTYAQLALAARGEVSADVLEAAMADPDRAARALAVRFAPEIAALPEASKRSLRLARRVVRLGLIDEDPVVRTEALRAAGTIGLDGGDEQFAAALTDEYLSIRVEAAGALLLAHARDRG